MNRKLANYLAMKFKKSLVMVTEEIERGYRSRSNGLSEVTGTTLIATFYR